MRLDKYLADMGIGSRSQVKELIKKGKVTVNGTTVKKDDTKVNPDSDQIVLEGLEISYQQFEYYMLNKPAGVVSATKDNVSKTVLDLITEKNRKDLFPVGRLDKDTEGLLLITNDGPLAHELLSPKKHVSKVYYAKIDGSIEDKHIEVFRKGIVLLDGTTTKPADLTIIKSGEESEIQLTIYEGKFHQVKRMFEAVGRNVTYLKRMSMGSLELDSELNTGAYRALTKDEIGQLIRGQQKE